MHVAGLAVADHEGKVCEKALLPRTQRLARPGKRCPCGIVEIAGGLFDCLIVISLERNGALAGEALDGLDHSGRIRTVTDEIPEKCVALDAALARVAQARLERFQIGVNVGQQRDQQRGLH